MPEATVLYSVTAVAVLGLIVWVAVVLGTAKEPWGRPPPPRLLPADVDVEPEFHATPEGGPTIDADETAKATPVALGEGRSSVTSEASAEVKPDVPAAKA